MGQSSVEKDRVAAIYGRVSTEEQAKLGQSLGVQLKALQKYAEERGYRVYDTYIDEGLSGADFSRPQLTRLRKDIQAGRIDIVLATHLDRLGRDGPELLKLLYKEFDKAGVHAEFTTERLNSSDDKDELIIYIRAQQAAEFRKRLTERSQASKIQLVEKGRWCGCLPPIGYELDRSTHTIKICPKEAELVKKVMEYHLQGWRAMKIAHELNRLAYPPVMARVYLPSPRPCAVIQTEKHSKSCYLRLGHEDYANHCVACIAQHGDQAQLVEQRGISRSTVTKILKQDLHKGHMVYGRTKKNTSEEGPDRNNQDQEKWVRSEKAITEALIDEDQFNEIQRRRRANAPATSRRGTYLLAGLIKCGNCGAPINGHTSGNYWVGYYCSARKNKGTTVCDMGTVKGNVVEPYIEQKVRQFLASIERESLFAEKQFNTETQLVLNLRDDIARLERLIDDNNEATERMLSLFEQGGSTPQAVKERLGKLESDRDSLETKLKNRVLQIEDAQKEIPTIEELQWVAQNFDEIWRSADIEDKKLLVRALIEKIVAYKDGRIKVIFAF